MYNFRIIKFGTINEALRCLYNLCNRINAEIFDKTIEISKVIHQQENRMQLTELSQ